MSRIYVAFHGVENGAGCYSFGLDSGNESEPMRILASYVRMEDFRRLRPPSSTECAVTFKHARAKSKPQSYVLTLNDTMGATDLYALVKHNHYASEIPLPCLMYRDEESIIATLSFEASPQWFAVFENFAKDELARHIVHTKDRILLLMLHRILGPERVNKILKQNDVDTCLKAALLLTESEIRKAYAGLFKVSKGHTVPYFVNSHMRLLHTLRAFSSIGVSLQDMTQQYDLT